MLDYLAENPVLLSSVTVFLGLLVGSFLNVVIYRLPRMMERDWQAEARAVLELPEPETPTARFNLITPGSRCGACGTPIKPWHNLPVLGWLLLRGRASCCGAQISIRYPFVEALTGFASLVCAWHFGYGTALLCALGISWALIALIFIDLDTMLLPDSITLPLLWAGLVATMAGVGFAKITLSAAVIGAAAGYLSLWSVHTVYKLLTGKHGFGGGDFKLLAALGAWLGWQALPQIILLSSVVGSAFGIAMMVFKGLKRDQHIPFGPYLAVAGWLAMMGVDVIGLIFKP